MISIQLLGAENQYSIGNINSELLEESVAVIREHQIRININDSKNYSKKEKFAVTILNAKGSYHSRFYTYYDKETAVKELSAIIYDKDGVEIERFKKKNIRDYSTGGDGVSISDDRVKLIDYQILKYPITIEFYSEISSNNTGFVPSWNPVYGFNVGIESSSYKLTKNEALTVRSELLPGSLMLPVEFDNTNTSIEASVTNIPSVNKETFCPALQELYPKLRVSLEEFYLHGYRGNSKSWSTLGRWYYENFWGKNLDLNPALIADIKSRTGQVSDPKEKAKIVYRYVQDNTRYISVQLGIGGWKPVAAKEVHQLGYGDCKGLTHYTRALLKSIDVDSHVAIVYAGKDKRDISKELPSIQGNHVILAIPFQGDTTWLECTSQTAPFGYIGEFTDDRDVLLVSQDGGRIVRTPKSDHQENVRVVNSTLHLNPEGVLSGNVQVENTGIHFNRSSMYESVESNDIEEYFLERFSHQNKLSIHNIAHSVDTDSIILHESLDIEIEDYGQLVGDEILLDLLTIRPPLVNVGLQRDRELPLVMRNGLTSVVKGQIILPNGWNVESFPEDAITLDDAGGQYKLEVSRIDNKITFYRELILYDGDFDAENYGPYSKFLRKVRKYDKTKILVSQ